MRSRRVSSLCRPCLALPRHAMPRRTATGRRDPIQRDIVSQEAEAAVRIRRYWPEEWVSSVWGEERNPPPTGRSTLSAPPRGRLAGIRELRVDGALVSGARPEIDDGGCDERWGLGAAGSVGRIGAISDNLGRNTLTDQPKSGHCTPWCEVSPDDPHSGRMTMKESQIRRSLLNPAFLAILGVISAGGDSLCRAQTTVTTPDVVGPNLGSGWGPQFGHALAAVDFDGEAIARSRFPHTRKKAPRIPTTKGAATSMSTSTILGGAAESRSPIPAAPRQTFTSATP